MPEKRLEVIENSEEQITVEFDGLTIQLWRSSLEKDRGQPVVQIDGGGMVRVNVNDYPIWNADPDAHEHEQCQCVTDFEDGDEIDEETAEAMKVSADIDEMVAYSRQYRHAAEAAKTEEFIVSKPASEMRPGDRFIFSEELGGEGEVVTVVSTIAYVGLVDIITEELDFRIQAMSHQWLTIAPEEEEEEA